MTRQLRTRTSRPNYAVLVGLADIDSDEAAGLSNTQVHESENTGSDFEVQQHQVEEESEDMALEPNHLESEIEPADESIKVILKEQPRRTASSREPSHAFTESATSAAPTRKKAQPKASAKPTVMLVSGLSHSTNRSMHALPSSNHRHKQIGIYQKKGKVERLAKAPTLFTPDMMTPTNAWAESPVINDRISRAWGYNTGAGPLWELLEDRAWFKESHGTSVTTERDRRPRVHKDVPSGKYQLLNAQDAVPYLPSDVKTTDDGTLRPPPPVACSFGPFGKQTRMEVYMFDSIKISQFFPGSMAHTFNAGAPVWGLDWCPMHPDDRVLHQYRQYLAVAPFPSHNHSPMVGSRAKRPTPACIQIWSLGPSAAPHEAMDVDEIGPSSAVQSEDAGEMRCDMVLCIDSGPAFELKWCPLPSNDPISEENYSPRKLGIIGGTFEDGSLTFFAVPDPTTIARPADYPVGTPIYVKLSQPLLRIEHEETSCWSFDWASSEVVAIGCTNGSIAVYNVAKALHDQSTSYNDSLLPTHYFPCHQSAIRSLAWVRAPVCSAEGEETADDPTVIVSGGYDGVECVTDIRDMRGNVMNRTRDVVTSMCFSSFTGSAITIDHENLIKAYSISSTMLGRGHTLLEPHGPIWSLAASDHHPQIAIGVTDGSCMTTNMMRSTRRGGTVPFLEHKIYQLDYSRALGEFRMLEHFLPKETQNRPAASRLNKSLPVGTGAWPTEVGIHRVVWNDGNGLARTPLLASATASGLCRIDWLLGQWAKDPIPYDGIEGIRDETGTNRRYDEDEEYSE